MRRALIGLLALLAGAPRCSCPQGAPPAQAAVTAADVARRLGERFHVDPATVAVDGVSTGYTRLRVLWAVLPAHNPPLTIAVEATTGSLVEVTYDWPGTRGLCGLSPVPERAPRKPAIDQPAAQRLAEAAVQSCLGGLPGTYQLAEAIYHDNGANLYYRFRWDEVVNGVRLPHRVAVTIDAFKGRVGYLSRLVFPVTVPLSQPRVTREEAIRIAMDGARPLLAPGEAVATPEARLEVDFGSRARTGGQQFLMWSVPVSSQPPASRPIIWVKVDAISGKVVDEWLGGGAPPPEPRPDAKTQGRQRSASALWSDRRVQAAALVLVGCLLLLSLFVAARRRSRLRLPSS